MKKLIYTLIILLFSFTRSLSQDAKSEIEINDARFAYPLIGKWTAAHWAMDLSFLDPGQKRFNSEKERIQQFESKSS
jgi:hypothetical protein